MATEKRLDLIDRQALGIGRCDPDAFPIQNRGYCAGWNGVIGLIEQAPTVDAVEVVHAKWEEWWPPKHMIFTGDEMLYRCSACDAKYADTEGYKYCPYCGAKMDGGKE